MKTIMMVAGIILCFGGGMTILCGIIMLVRQTLDIGLIAEDIATVLVIGAVGLMMVAGGYSIAKENSDKLYLPRSEENVQINFKTNDKMTIYNEYTTFLKKLKKQSSIEDIQKKLYSSISIDDIEVDYSKEGTYDLMCNIYESYLSYNETTTKIALTVVSEGEAKKLENKGAFIIYKRQDNRDFRFNMTANEETESGRFDFTLPKEIFVVKNSDIDSEELEKVFLDFQIDDSEINYSKEGIYEVFYKVVTWDKEERVCSGIVEIDKR